MSAEFIYKYETHLHTSQGSACGQNTGSEMAVACKKAGYAGIIVTDHFFYGNTAVDRSLPWSEWVENFVKGYEDALETGKKIGLDVFFGWESCYKGTDFLIYGLDKEWLINHPEIKDASIEEQYKLVHADGGMVIHAHPFREEFYIPVAGRVFPESVDGVETFNVTNAVKYDNVDATKHFNLKAKQYAQKYNMPETEGSDIHSTNLMGGGMFFDSPLRDINDFMERVLAKKGILASSLK